MWQTLLNWDCIIKNGIDLRNMAMLHIRAIDFAPLGFRLSGQSLLELVEEYEPKEPRAGKPKKEPIASRCRTPPRVDQCVCRWSGLQIRESDTARIFVWIADSCTAIPPHSPLVHFPFADGLARCPQSFSWESLIPRRSHDFECDATHLQAEATFCVH